jgi:hypothetical protein
MRKNRDFNRALRRKLRSLKGSTAFDTRSDTTDAIDDAASSLDVVVENVGDRGPPGRPYPTLAINKRTRDVIARFYSDRPLSATTIAPLLMRCAAELGLIDAKEQ